MWPPTQNGTYVKLAVGANHLALFIYIRSGYEKQKRSGSALKTASEIRKYLYERLQFALARPGMLVGAKGCEGIMLDYLSHLAFVDDKEQLLGCCRRFLHDHGAIPATGINGAFWLIAGEYNISSWIGNVYACVADILGVLDVERRLSDFEMEELCDGLPELVAANDLNTQQVLEKFGTPSWPIKATSKGYGKTGWLYLGTRQQVELIPAHNQTGIRINANVSTGPPMKVSSFGNYVAFEFWNEYDESAQRQSWGRFGRYPMLSHIRLPAKTWNDEFTFTPFNRSTIKRPRIKLPFRSNSETDRV